MVWHLRTSQLKLGESHWELELLSPNTIRQELQNLMEEKCPERVRDWKGKIAGLFNEQPLGLEEDIQRIFKV